MPKGMIFKLRAEPTARPWIGILPSGACKMFATWAEAAEYLGAPLRSAE